MGVPNPLPPVCSSVAIVFLTASLDCLVKHIPKFSFALLSLFSCRVVVAVLHINQKPIVSHHLQVEPVLHHDFLSKKTQSWEQLQTVKWTPVPTPSPCVTKSTRWIVHYYIRLPPSVFRLPSSAFGLPPLALFSFTKRLEKILWHSLSIVFTVACENNRGFRCVSQGLRIEPMWIHPMWGGCLLRIRSRAVSYQLMLFFSLSATVDQRLKPKIKQNIYSLIFSSISISSSSSSSPLFCLLFVVCLCLLFIYCLFCFVLFCCYGAGYSSRNAFCINFARSSFALSRGEGGLLD